MIKIDFVFDTVLKRCLEQGATQNESRNAAQMANDDYKKGKYKKIGDMIDAYVKRAVKNSKITNMGKAGLNNGNVKR